jgi:Leucine-rich repeat (LRR) protein
LIELSVKNKVIENISTSNLKEFLSVNLKFLAINDCKIKSINKGIFNQMIQLSNLSLANNEIDSMENNSFLTEPFESHLIELYLSNNKLSKIHRELFNGLSKLEILCLANNLITEIGVDTFEKIPKLKQLHLHSNNIKVIHNEMFLDKLDLEVLYLYQNNIESIEIIPFNSLYSLKKLHLFSNKITNIKIGNFIHLVKLEELMINKNEINSFEISTFTGLGNMARLDLSGNKIKELVNGVFNSLKNLKRLDLHLNDILGIETNVFKDLLNLNYLNLDSNKITSLKQIQFHQNLSELSIRSNMLSYLNEINSNGLKFFYASNNLIQSINLNNSMPILEHLDVSQNRLIKISENSFVGLKKLRFLNLSGNKLDLQSQFNNISYFHNQILLETLDLSFNEIKYLDSNVTFQKLSSLKILNLQNNKLNSIGSYLFGYLIQLTELNLVSNNISFLSEYCLFNQSKLKVLRLSLNQIISTCFFRNNNFTKELEILDLEQNRIAFIEGSTFQFYPKLKLLNLNSNPIKSLPTNLFTNFVLQSLKLSNTSISLFSFNSNNLKELDLSYLNISILDLERFKCLEWICLANSKTNVPFGVFISNLTKYVDFSYTIFDFRILNVLGPAMETLKLRQTNLQNIEEINLKNQVNLKHLDLSFNNLTFLSPDILLYTPRLEYLDLSSNSLSEFKIVLNNLRHLNLDNNQIEQIDEVLWDFFLIEIFKMANNKLKVYPYFDKTQVNVSESDTFLEIHLNNNQINKIEYFSVIVGNLKLLNFESNSISLIEPDAFLNCRSLEYLSLADNHLANLTEDMFHFLFSIVNLNLSYNEIKCIENASFKNLNKLKVLDLNYNKILSIENNMFYGLSNLNFLFILSQSRFKIYNESFKHLTRIGTIYLNESLIFEYQCLFMRIQDKVVQREIANKYLFYKSINLLTVDFSLNESLKLKCNLVFRFFQLNVHLNLKSEESFELFLRTCQNLLINKINNFIKTKKQLDTCSFKQIELIPDLNENEINGDTKNSFQMVFSNIYYLLTMFLLIILIGPLFIMILNDTLFLDQSNDLSSYNERVIKELELKIEKVKKEFIILKNDYQKTAHMIQTKENDLIKMEEKLLLRKSSI